MKVDKVFIKKKKGNDLITLVQTKTEYDSTTIIRKECYNKIGVY